MFIYILHFKSWKRLATLERISSRKGIFAFYPLKFHNYYPLIGSVKWTLPSLDRVKRTSPPHHHQQTLSSNVESEKLFQIRCQFRLWVSLMIATFKQVWNIFLFEIFFSGDEVWEIPGWARWVGQIITSFTRGRHVDQVNQFHTTHHIV